jgi:hypothetical protein
MACGICVVSGVKPIQSADAEEVEHGGWISLWYYGQPSQFYDIPNTAITVSVQMAASSCHLLAWLDSSTTYASVAERKRDSVRMEFRNVIHSS